VGTSASGILKYDKKSQAIIFDNLDYYTPEFSKGYVQPIIA
jgi:hypothetical protein